MGDSNIQWTNKTWNPITGCTKVSPGCDNCYAEAITKRFKLGPFEQVTMHLDRMAQPFAWKKPQMIFVCSMSDLFHPAIPWEFVHEIFEVMIANSHHTFQILTKRPGRMAYFSEEYLERSWPKNVWAGTSVEMEWDGNRNLIKRLDVLTKVPAAVRFVSVEPLLGPVDLKPWLGLDAEVIAHGPLDRETASALVDLGRAAARKFHGIQWVIAGGESGPKARVMDPEWVRTLRDDCLDAQVPFFFKQWGAHSPFFIDLENGWEDAAPDQQWMYERAIGPGGNYIGRPRSQAITMMAGGAMMKARLGTKDTGAMLDGAMWRKFPGESLVNRETWKPVNA